MKAECTTVLLPRTVLETGADKDIEYEGTLADYLPGINRIIRAEANVLCEEAELSGSKAEIKGKAVFALLYESDYKNKLKSESFTVDFTQRFDVGELPDGQCFPTVSCKCSYVSCKTLNPRRFVLRCRADIGLCVKCMQKVEVVSAADCKGAFFKEETHTLWEYCPPIRRDFGIKETLSLDTLPPINEIVYTSVHFTPAEASLSEGNALIRCNAVIKCLYEEESDTGALRYTEKSFPASFNIDDESISENSRASVSVNCISVDGIKEMDGYGENRIINVSCSAAVGLECAKPTKVTVPTDMFFEEYETSARTERFIAETPDEVLRHRFELEKAFELPDTAFESCTDTNAEISISEAAVSEKGVTVKGNCVLNVLGKCADGFRAHDINASFTENVPYTPKISELKLKTDCNVLNATAELTSDGRLNIRVSAELKLQAVEKECFVALTDAEISKRESDEKSTKPIIIYYAEKGESAWEIGKRYHIDPSRLRLSNPHAFDGGERIATKGTLLYM